MSAHQPQSAGARQAADGRAQASVGEEYRQKEHRHEVTYPLLPRAHQLRFIEQHDPHHEGTEDGKNAELVGRDGGQEDHHEQHAK